MISIPKKRLNKKRFTIGYWLARLILVFLLIVTFFPFILMIFMSLKSSIDIMVDFWGIPSVPEYSNYVKAFNYLVRPIFNTIFVAAVTLAVELLLVGISAYTFARFKFKGKEFIYMMFMAIMMMPYVLMLVPVFTIILKLRLLDSYLALIIPYVAGLQIFGIIIARSYFSGIPESLFESARIQGAGELYIFVRIALPLAIPILITVGITSLISIYNDYIWPTLILSGEAKKMFSQAVVALNQGHSSDAGLSAAGYVVGSLPLLIITGSCLKYYLKGIMQGAVKG